MKKLIKYFGKKLLPERLLFMYQAISISFSQDGEDLILDGLFDKQSNGFYIDVGAHHPFRFSNTYKFYRKGWRGINIDASPTLLPAFKKHRPRDINLNCLVSGKVKSIEFYIFNEQALNTTEKSVVENILTKHPGKYYITETITVTAQTLSAILEDKLPPNKTIDFMSVDCEGHDLEVLQSNDWGKYRPKVIVVEIKEAFEDVSANAIYQYLAGLGYNLVTKQKLSSVFVDKKYH